MATPGNSELPPEAIAFATRMYDAARSGQMDVFQQALPAGLPANMMNEKGDSLVSVPSFLSSTYCIFLPSSMQLAKLRITSWFWAYLGPFCYGMKDEHIANKKKVMLAAYHGHAQLVKLLIQHGADPNRVNDRGQTPLAGAVFKGEAEVIEVCYSTWPHIRHSFLSYFSMGGRKTVFGIQS